MFCLHHVLIGCTIPKVPDNACMWVRCDLSGYLPVKTMHLPQAGPSTTGSTGEGRGGNVLHVGLPRC